MATRKRKGEPSRATSTGLPSDFDRFMVLAQHAAPTSLPPGPRLADTHTSRDDYEAIIATANALLCQLCGALRGDRTAQYIAAAEIARAIRGPSESSRVGGALALRRLVLAFCDADRKLAAYETRDDGDEEAG
jgi:hypothetical protein